MQFNKEVKDAGAIMKTMVYRKAIEKIYFYFPMSYQCTFTHFESLRGVNTHTIFNNITEVVNLGFKLTCSHPSAILVFETNVTV